MFGKVHEMGVNNRKYFRSKAVSIQKAIDAQIDVLCENRLKQLSAQFDENSSFAIDYNSYNGEDCLSHETHTAFVDRAKRLAYVEHQAKLESILKEIDDVIRFKIIKPLNIGYSQVPLFPPKDTTDAYFNRFLKTARELGLIYDEGEK